MSENDTRNSTHDEGKHSDTESATTDERSSDSDDDEEEVEKNSVWDRTNRKYNKFSNPISYLETESTELSLDSSTPSSFQVVIVGEKSSQLISTSSRHISKKTIHHIRPMFLMNNPISTTTESSDTIGSSSTLMEHRQLSVDDNEDSFEIDIMNKVNTSINRIAQNCSSLLLEKIFIPFSLIWALKNRQKRRLYKSQPKECFLVFPANKCQRNNWYGKPINRKHYYYRYTSRRMGSRKV